MKTGVQTTYQKRLNNISRTLSAEYYREISVKKEKKEKKSHHWSSTEDRKKEIAEYIRKHGDKFSTKELRKELKCSDYLIDVVLGMMYLGKI